MGDRPRVHNDDVASTEERIAVSDAGNSDVDGHDFKVEYCLQEVTESCFWVGDGYARGMPLQVAEAIARWAFRELTLKQGGVGQVGGLDAQVDGRDASGLQGLHQVLRYRFDIKGEDAGGVGSEGDEALAVGVDQASCSGRFEDNAGRCCEAAPGALRRRARLPDAGNDKIIVCHVRCCCVGGLRGR